MCTLPKFVSDGITVKSLYQFATLSFKARKKNVFAIRWKEPGDENHLMSSNLRHYGKFITRL